MNRKYNNADYFDARDGDIKESVCDNKKLKNILDTDSFVIFKERILSL